MIDLPPLIMNGITTYNNSSVSTKCLLVSSLIVVKTLTTVRRQTMLDKKGL